MGGRAPRALALTGDAQPTLETPRLRLRPFRPSDAPDVQRLAGARAVASTTLTLPHPYPDGAAEAWIATHGPEWAAGRQVVCAVTTADAGVLLGAVGITRTPPHAGGELGYWIAEHAWGRGYATEAAAALCAYAFASLGVHRVQARHFLRNPASGRVMRKLGMRHEGVLRDAVRKDGRFESLALYAVLATEWPPAPAVAPSAADVEIRVSPPLADAELDALFAAAWPDHVPRGHAATLARSLAWCAAFEAGALVGFVNVAWDGGAHAFLLDPTVHPAHRRRGVGLALVRAAAAAAAERGARWLHVDYEPALAPFYAAAGFRHTEAGLIRLGE